MAEKHEHHHWLIIGLLICILALVVLLGFFGYQLFYGNRIETIKRVEVDDSFLDEIIDEGRRAIDEDLGPLEIPVTQIQDENLLTFKGSAIAPGFQYPESWHIFSSTIFDSRPGYIETILIDDEPIQIGEGEAFFAIHVSTIDRATADLEGASSYLAYHDLKHPSGDFYSESYRSTKQTSGGSLTEIHARESGILDADIQYIIFESSSYSVAVKFTDLLPGDEDNNAWETIKSSLDFSSIQ